MMRRGARLCLLALAPLSLHGAASAQVIPAPGNNFQASVNGMASLCLFLVGGQPVPDATVAAPFGFRPIAGPSQRHDFEGLFDDGALLLRFEPAERTCTVHYAGPRFPAVAQMARNIANLDGFTRVTGGERGGAQGDVFDRVNAALALRARYIIIENPTSQTAAVSYSERANP